jgi:hypothetical protein
MNRMFADYVSAPLPTAPNDPLDAQGNMDLEGMEALDGGDVCLHNVLGDKAAQEIAERWGESANTRRRLEAMRPWLEGESREIVDRLLLQGIRAGPSKPSRGHRIRYGDSEEDTDEDHDEKGRVAHLLFAEHTTDGRWWHHPSSPSHTAADSSTKPADLTVVTPVSSSLRQDCRPSGKRRRNEGATGLVSPPPTASTMKAEPMASLRSIRRLDPLVDVNNFVGGRPISVGHGPELAPPHKKRKAASSGSDVGENFASSYSKSGSQHATPKRRASPDVPHSPRNSQNTAQPLSPATTKRRAFRAERLKIGEKLSRARPDLVLPTYATTRARLLSQRLKPRTNDGCAGFLRSKVMALESFEVDGANVCDGDGMD